MVAMHAYLDYEDLTRLIVSGGFDQSEPHSIDTTLQLTVKLYVIFS